MAVERLSQTFGVITVLDTAIAVTFSDARDVSQGCIQKISYKGQSKGEPIRMWGRKNDLPQFREQVIGDNNITGALIQTKRDILLGTGLYAYKVDFKSDGGMRNTTEVKIPMEAQDFFDMIDIDCFHMDATRELLFHSNIFTEFIRNKGGGIHSMAIKECKYTRLAEQNSRGRVEHAYISGAWATGEYAKDGVTVFDREVVKIPLYNPEKVQNQFILHTGDRMLNDGYYNSPTWWGALNWIELANSIPVFHQANILNGYTIRYHIRIPKNYFYNAPTGDDNPAAAVKARDDEQLKRQEFMDNVNTLLAGKQNAGRALFTQFDINDQLGKEYPGISIEPINVDIKDKALLELFEKSNTANISAQGIHPTLANIESQGKLSSGSEMRNAFNVYLAVKTNTPRKIILKSLELAKKINKWDPDIYFGFGDTELTTLDDSPTGKVENVATVPDAA